MTVGELENMIDQAYQANKEQYADVVDLQNIDVKSILLTALTMPENDFISDEDIALESIQLWSQRIEKKSELLLGTKYISIKDTVINLLLAIISSGALEVIVQLALGNVTSAISVPSTLVGLVTAFRNIFKSASSLSDDDFCVYFQALIHNKKHKKFKFNELCEWFKACQNESCKIQQEKWDCAFCKDGLCKITTDNIKDAVKSLLNKKILISITKQGKKLGANCGEQLKEEMTLKFGI